MNIVGHVGHRVSAAATQLCCFSARVIDKQMNGGRYVPIAFYLFKMGKGLCFVHRPYLPSLVLGDRPLITAFIVSLSFRQETHSIN